MSGEMRCLGQGERGDRDRGDGARACKLVCYLANSLTVIMRHLVRTKMNIYFTFSFLCFVDSIIYSLVPPRFLLSPFQFFFSVILDPLPRFLLSLFAAL